MRCFFWIFALFAFSVARCFSSDATFSKDGQHVYAIEFASPVDKTSHLFDIDIEKQSASKIDIGAQIGSKPIVAVTTSKAGDLLIATEDAAWSCNIDRKSCTKLCSVPEGLKFKDLACTPGNSAILFSTRDGLSFQEKPDVNPWRAAFVFDYGEGKLFPVGTRRVESIDGIAFSPQSDLFFGSRGDLWYGIVSKVDIINKRRKEMGKPPLPPQPGEVQHASLAARRCAPLATLETYDGTPMQIGVSKVAISSGMVYVHLLRMYGTGVGEIGRLAAPPDIEENWGLGVQDGLDDRLHLYAKEASSVEILAENEDYSYLCASPDGKRVFFRARLDPGTGRQEYGFYLIENNGKPRELKVKLPE
jgi:hypothetical protein